MVACLARTGEVHSAQTRAPDFPSQLAQGYLQAGREEEASHELRQLLVMESASRQAQQQLAFLQEKHQAQRNHAIERTVARLQASWDQAREQAIHKALRDAGLPPPSLTVNQDMPPRLRGGLTPASPAVAPAGMPHRPSATRPPILSTPAEAQEPSLKDLSAGAQGGVLQRLNQRLAPVAVSGEVRSTVGITRDDFLLQEANGDLNERNFRVFSGPFRYNTFDPRVFSRLRLNLDTTEQQGLQFHSNLTVDPWSVVGKTARVTVVGTTPTDSVEVELKWWSATNTAINETLLTLTNGDSIATPEIEVSEGRTVPTSVKSVFSNTFQIPSLEVDYTFQPIRWFWTGYRNDVVDLRVFPLALEDQALTSDDPLHLSNHHIYWEPSPWLDEWRAGRLNVGATPDDFTRGEWSDDLAFFTRDSDLTRLTALRGGSLRWQVFDGTSLQAAIASPKGLWQEYERFDSFVAMTRVKQELFEDRVSLGGLYTARWGYNKRSKDATNTVYAVDVSVAPWEGTKIESEGAISHALEDRTSAFKHDRRGWAWHSALTNDWWGERLSSRLYYTHMDAGFEPGLANYRNTRQDQFWGRHLRFKRRPRLFTAVSPVSSLRWEDIDAVRIGDGVDIGRDAVGFRLLGSFWDKQVQPSVDVRNVHQTRGKYVETVIRQENTVHPLKWLTAKTLFIYHDLPKTIGGLDPFVVNADTNRPLNNAAIVNGRNPSLTTFSVGAELAPRETVSVWGIWERTNDTTIATGNFPRGLLNDTTFATFTDEDQVIRFQSPFLYSQGFFPQPPYPFFDIFRAGVFLAPTEDLEMSLDWTRNEFEHAGQIDDNLNHLGLMAGWSPTKRLIVIGRYVVSWAIDVTNENAGGGAKFASHHGLYGRLTWKATSDSDLSVEFGEAALGPSILFTVDPSGDSYPTLDTEHLVRIIYSNRF